MESFSLLFTRSGLLLPVFPHETTPLGLVAQRSRSEIRERVVEPSTDGGSYQLRVALRVVWLLYVMR